MHRKVVARLITLLEARAAMDRVFTLPIEATHDADLYDSALLMADQFGLPAAYDAIYLALCARKQCDLWTADQRLVRVTRGRLSWLRSIESFEG